LRASSRLLTRIWPAERRCSGSPDPDPPAVTGETAGPTGGSAARLRTYATASALLALRRIHTNPGTTVVLSPVTCLPLFLPSQDAAVQVSYCKL
jgi:hypothetical protein